MSGPTLIFRSRRALPAGADAGPQAPAARTAGVVQSAPAAPFRPFRAYALAYAARGPGRVHLCPSTLSAKRRGVREGFIGLYRDRATGQRHWIRALENGARIVRVIVSAEGVSDLQGSVT